MLVGDFDPAKALAIVNKHYGSIPKSPQPIPVMYTEEPPQTGPRRVTLKHDRRAWRSVIIAYKAPSGLEKDVPALNVLGSVLSAGENSRLSQCTGRQVSGDLRRRRHSADARSGPVHDARRVSRRMRSRIRSRRSCWMRSRK